MLDRINRVASASSHERPSLNDRCSRLRSTFCTSLRRVYHVYKRSFRALRSRGRGVSSPLPGSKTGLQMVRALGKRAGVALNPATPVGAIEPVLDELDLVLVMTVNPGFGGQRFIEASVDKIRRAHMLLSGRGIHLEVDGGINAETAAKVVAAGADVLVAGSAIFGQPDYAEAIARLRPAIAG